MNTNIIQLYRDYLKGVKLMQLATCRDNRPWLCNVWFAIDENDKIYFISRETRRHSIEIADNENVACTFHKHFERGLGEKGQALIVSGAARKLPGPETETPFRLYNARFPNLAPFQPLEKFLDESGHHFFYEITPREIVWWDEVNFPDQSRQQVL